MEFFANIFNGWKSSIIFTKSPILDVWKGSEYTLYNKTSQDVQ